MVRRLTGLLLCAVLLCGAAQAQEVLLPLVARATAPALGAKAQPDTLGLPFFDDFADYEGLPDPRRWQAGGGHVEAGNGELPPTVGMLTLDALDAQGHLYAHASTASFPADTVGSQPLNLAATGGGAGVWLSFYYLPGGGRGNLWEHGGDTPDPADSLMLDFYDSRSGQWSTVWGAAGVSVDTLIARTGLAWQYVCLRLDDGLRFDPAFRFRFRNRCSIDPLLVSTAGRAGNCDQWHIDYVRLDTAVAAPAATAVRDVAFVAPAPSMLADYEAMPARQYRAADMAAALGLTITNLHSSEITAHYGFSVSDTAGDTLYRYDGGYENVPPFLPAGTYQQEAAHATPEVRYAFPESDEPRAYTITHVVREGIAGDARPANDTLRRTQRFADHYAYDDGTAEEGYGLSSTASHVYLACHFRLNVTDTLTAVDLHFNSAYHNENLRVPFHITVWRAGADGKPSEVLYRDSEPRTISQEGLDTYLRYRLERGVAVGGDIFVGFEQTSNEYINLGFDRSRNASAHIFYLTDTEWKQSILSGALMLRPCFEAASQLSVEAPQAEARVRLFPNPASDAVRLVAEGFGPEPLRADIIDPLGRLLASQPVGAAEAVVPVGHLPEGVYLLRLSSARQCATSRLIIKH